MYLSIRKIIISIFIILITISFFISACSSEPDNTTPPRVSPNTPTITVTPPPTVTFPPIPTITTSPTPVGPLEIPANPEQGFEWPYLLYIPSMVSGDHLLVVPNNTGHRDNDFNVHVDSAKYTMQSRISWADSLEIPLLVPIFPRFEDNSDGTIASQYLGRGTIEDYWINQYPLLAREDLQMVAMIDDAINRVNEYDINIDNSVLIEGYSASAMFTSRFTILHPDRIQASAFGGHGWTIVPTNKWKNLSLPYPYGTGDIELLTEKPFDLDEFKQIPIYVYMGEDDDCGWALPWYIGGGYNQGAYYSQFKSLFGSSAIELSDSADEIYRSLECTATFITYKNQNHMSAYSHMNDILAFFEKYK